MGFVVRFAEEGGEMGFGVPSDSVQGADGSVPLDHVYSHA